MHPQLGRPKPANEICVFSKREPPRPSQKGPSPEQPGNEGTPPARDSSPAVQSTGATTRVGNKPAQTRCTRPPCCTASPPLRRTETRWSSKERPRIERRRSRLHVASHK